MKVVYPRKNGVRSIKFHNQLLAIGSGSKQKNSQMNLFLQNFLPNRKSHLIFQSAVCL